jgi:hypothetical protein
LEKHALDMMRRRREKDGCYSCHVD